MPRKTLLLALLVLALGGCSSAPQLPLAPAGEFSVLVEDAPGVSIVANVSKGGGVHHADVAAHNAGPRTWWLPSQDDCGLDPLTESVRGQQGKVAMNESHCDICSSMEFPPGATVRASFRWDGAAFDPERIGTDDNPPRPVPPGQYTWSFRLLVRPHQDCPTLEETVPEALLDVPITVG